MMLIEVGVMHLDEGIDGWGRGGGEGREWRRGWLDNGDDDEEEEDEEDEEEDEEEERTATGSGQ